MVKMNRWDNLSLQEKNQLLGIYASKGYTDLASIISHYNTFQAGGSIKKESNYSVGRVLDGIYRAVNHDEFMGEPSHKYQFIKPEYVGLSEEELDSLVGQADERGHRLDVVKAEAHPSHYSRGTWSGNDFELTDKGLDEVNHTYFGLNDGGQDPQARLTYKGSTVLPEITITPDGAYIYNTYDNIKLHLKQQGGSLGKVTPYGQWQYPHQVTTIPSNNITMKGVDYPVIGVSNTGDTKYMLPNTDYLFEGQYVTEYPVHKFQIGGIAQTQLELKNRRQVKDRKEGKFPSLIDLLNGYLNNPEGTYMTDNYTEDQLQEFRRRAYANYMPYYTGFSGIINFKRAVDNTNTNPNTRNIYAGNGEHDVKFLDDLYATYMNIPIKDRRYQDSAGKYLIPSIYKPTSGATYNNIYSLNPEMFNRLNDDIVNLYYLSKRNDWRKSNSHVTPGDDIFEERGGYPIDWSPLGDFILSRGFDENGEYISLYDDWDLNPIKGKSSEFKWLQDNKHGDLTQGLGHPYSIYNKVYLKDYYGVDPQGGIWLPELTIWDYAEDSSRGD